MQIECYTNEEIVTVSSNKFNVWKGSDVWHQDFKINIRLEPDGNVFLSTQEGHVSTLRTATISLEQLHAVIKEIIVAKNS